VPGGHGARDAVFRRVIRRYSSPVGDMTLGQPSSSLEARPGQDGVEGLTGALV
jgi:hypothetical protein